MKIKKIGCVCAVAVCVAVIGIIAAALNPSLQTRIASSVLEGKFAGAKLQKLDAGDIFHIGGRIGAAASGRHKDIAKIRKN